MKLRDFRQFRNEQSIQFSTDPDRNVTIIMGENGSGKTTLAQAFTWCLYGDTDFEDTEVLNKIKAQEMGPNQECIVKVELLLRHLDVDYTMIREQKYTTDSVGGLKRPNNTIFRIAYKNVDGQTEFIKDTETEFRMKEILPKELSRYFFFDGERIGNMSKEIRRGRSPEFAEAVKRLLGLSAFSAALDHLNGRSQNSVIKSYEKDYDSKSDSKILEYTNEMDRYDTRLQEIDSRLVEIDNERLTVSDKVKEIEQKISDNKDSEKYAQERIKLNKKLNGLSISKVNNTVGIIQLLNNRVTSWMSQRLIYDALQELASSNKIDTGIPDIHARTVQYLIKRGTCLCGREIEFGNDAHKELMRLLDYIPPQSVGTIIGQFIRECELKSKAADGTFDELSEKYSIVRNFENDYDEVLHQIESINKKLEGMANVGELQKRYTYYNTELKKMDIEHDRLIEERGKLQTKRERCETNINELSLKDENNRRVARFKAYAVYISTVECNI